MKTILFGCLFFGGLSLVSARPVMLSRVDAQADLDSLYGFIREVHPDMFATCPQNSFDAEFYDYCNNLPDSVPMDGFYVTATRLVSLLGDGHTRLGVCPLAKMDTDPAIFPLGVKVHSRDTSLLVVEPWVLPSDTLQFLSGSRIERINGMSAKELLVDMMRYVSGERAFFRLEGLNHPFQQLMYALHRTDRYEIVCRDSTGTEHTVVLPGVLLSEIRAYQQTHPQCSESQAVRHPDYTFEVLPGEIGLLTYNNCRNWGKFTHFCDSVFQVVQERKIGDMIIDVRKNPGGDSRLNDTLFRYISSMPFQQFDHMISRISDPVRRVYGKNVPAENGIIRMEGGGLIAPREDSLRYRGRCYELISHYTFSSAASFAWAFQYFRMGKAIGEETGGQVVCFGDIIQYKLPHSQLPLACSYRKMYQYGGTDDNRHGVLPDYEVPAERALDFTLEFINKQREGTEQ